MIFPIKKAFLLNGFIALLICFTAYAGKSLADMGDDWPVSSPPEPAHLNTCAPETHTHETRVVHHHTYDEYIQSCTSNETKDYACNTYFMGHDDCNDSDSDLSAPNVKNPDIEPSYDLSNDSALETRRQDIDEHQTAQIEAEKNKYLSAPDKIIRELSIPKNVILRASDVQDRIFDSTIILQNTHTVKDLITALDSPIIKAYFERTKRSIERVNVPKKGRAHPSKNRLDYLDLLISGKISEVLKQTMNPDLNIAEAAFDELAQLWPWRREHTFLGPELDPRGTGEPGFINIILGVDIMKVTEKDLIIRKDYIAKYLNEPEQKIIQKYKEKCYELQQNGNSSALFNEKQELYHFIRKNNGKTNLIDDICLTIVENCWLDPMTYTFRSIIHAQSLEKACDHVKKLEKQITTQAGKLGIVNLNEVRAWSLDRYGFDLLSSAHNRYKSRPDYVYKPDNQSYFSDVTQPILHNIASENLTKAHAELVNLKKQIHEAIVKSNITDPIAQKEYIKKAIGRNIVKAAQKTYEARADHKELAESFIPIDVNQSTVTILENNNTYESVANEMNTLAKNVFANGYRCNLSNLPQIESHVHDTIEAMKIAQDHPTFIFNLSMVNHTLGDIQQLAHAVLTGTHPVLTRSSELLTRGFESFFKGLNPVTQAQNMGHLAKSLGSFLGKSWTALRNDPIGVIHTGMNSTCTLIDLIRATADFTSDLTIGRLYLSTEDYQQRLDAFSAIIQPLKGVSAEQCVDFAAQLAADITITKGIGTAYSFLKKLDALEKLSESAIAVARTFKRGFDIHLGDHPVVITAEGIVLKMSNGMKNFNKGPNEIINSAKALLESVYTPIANALKAEIELLKQIKLPHGFAEFSHKPIRIAYEHILGMEIDLNRKGKLIVSGFHQDFKNAIEKSGVLKFTNKILNEHGCYIADLVTDGLRIPDKTFFPANWSQREVINKINEAYNSFIKSGIVPELNNKGKYMIRGFTAEGIEIEMCFTISGEMKTAYPIVTRGI